MVESEDEMRNFNEKLTYLDCVDKSKPIKELDDMVEFIRMEVHKHFWEVFIEEQNELLDKLFKRK